MYRFSIELVKQHEERNLCVDEMGELALQQTSATTKQWELRACGMIFFSDSLLNKGGGGTSSDRNLYHGTQ